jgi:hypothetical protein
MRQHRRGECRHQAFGRKGVTWRGVVDLLAMVGLKPTLRLKPTLHDAVVG